ncbi:Proteasome subunit alpha type-2, partial [Ascosphaera pollenicola]
VHEFTFVPDLACTDPGPSKATPPPVPNNPKHRAVAFDCEMVGYLPYKASAGLGKERSEVVSLSAVDMLTGKILINTLVKPPRGGQIRWRKRFTGMDPRKLAMAEARKQVLPSWEVAREELWKYVDSSTILVGHALHHDLKCLRMVHTRVVDSEILAADPAFGFDDRRQWSLRNLCSRQLGIMIQSAYKPHDALEDTYATREVVLSMLQGLKKSDGENIARQN